ncbi:MAG: hypothetical protein ACRDPW_08695, partial [Mycobacteriales bacterium]
VHVTVPRLFRGLCSGVVIHVAPLAPEEIVVWDDVPVVGVARALVDVATAGDPTLATGAAVDAIDRGLITSDQISTHLAGRSDMGYLKQLLLPIAERTSTR